MRDTAAVGPPRGTLVDERTLPRTTRRSTDHHPLRNGTADRCVSTCHGLALANKVLGAESYQLLRRAIGKRIFR